MKKIILIMLIVIIFVNIIACNKQKTDIITNEQALAAIQNYCNKNIPGLDEMINDNEYPTYFDVSSDDKNIIVIFRSYTSSINRYYIDKNTGDTYVTEFVPGITEEEQKTDEKFNIKQYLS